MTLDDVTPAAASLVGEEKPTTAPPALDKAAFQQALAAARDELLDLQSELRGRGDSALALIISGTPAAGRSETVNELLQWLDPKYITVVALAADEHDARPPLWRFWRRMPARGRMTFYLGGWYSDYLYDASRHPEQPPAADSRWVQRVIQFERMLVRDGVRLVKIHLQTDAETQRERLVKLRASKLTRWRVTREDRWLAKHHDEVEPIVQACLQATDHEDAPWHRIDGTDERRRLLDVASVLLNALRGAVKPRAIDKHRPQRIVGTRLGVQQTRKRVKESDYDVELALLQGRLARATRKRGFRRRGLVLAFEGMDAAGKGGAIRRVTAALDARQYQVVPVSAPSREEAAHPYLWRFWRDVPALGGITIFDRSWYGRVMVERVRGFTAEADWQRAYREIVEFERQLSEHGLLVAKFWLSISKPEQLKRLRARENERLKRFKLDEEDWVNRRHFDAYERAAAQMIELTDSPEARWHVVAANDKRHARLEVLRQVCDLLER